MNFWSLSFWVVSHSYIPWRSCFLVHFILICMYEMHRKIWLISSVYCIYAAWARKSWIFGVQRRVHFSKCPFCTIPHQVYKIFATNPGLYLVSGEVVMSPFDRWDMRDDIWRDCLVLCLYSKPTSSEIICIPFQPGLLYRELNPYLVGLLIHEFVQTSEHQSHSCSTSFFSTEPHRSLQSMNSRHP